jgi:hypothetical protein
VLDPTFVEDEYDLGHGRRHCGAPILSAGFGKELLDSTRSVSMTLRPQTDGESLTIAQSPSRARSVAKFRSRLRLAASSFLIENGADQCRLPGRDRAAPSLRIPAFRAPTTKELDSLELESLRAPFRVAGQRVRCDPCA